MALGYSRVFAPYIVPQGGPLDGVLVPEPRWAALMAMGQLRATVGAGALTVEQHTRGVGWLQGLHQVATRLRAALAPDAVGQIPTEGDAEFAYARLAGTNPLQIRRVRSIGRLPASLRLDDNTLERLTTTRRSLAERAADGDLLLLEYPELAVPDAAALQSGRFVAPVSALFCRAPELDSPFPLAPLAIACPADGFAGEPRTVTPLDGPAWQAAKRMVAVADINTAELVLHLARAHHMITPFAVALRRCLDRQHTLYRFLYPHLRFNLFVDRMAWQAGVRKDSGVLVGSLAGTSAWSQQVAKSLYHNQSFREQQFERDLQARDVADLPIEYPYRDDGRLLVGALERFCRGLVARAYPSDAEVRADAALQRFVADVAAPEGGNVRGLLAGERLETLEELVDLLSQILFVAGPLHALAHYSSAAQLQDAHANPSWLNTNPLQAPERSHPGILGAMAQYRRVISTNVRYGTLGDFADVPFGQDPQWQPLIGELQRELVEIESEIQRRNQQRLAPFVHFLPSRIPNGITV